MALSLPAFVILVEVIVESDFPFANMAVPIIVTGFGLFIFRGIIILLRLLVASISWQLRVTVVSLLLGLLAILVGVALLGFRTTKVQESKASGD